MSDTDTHAITLPSEIIRIAQLGLASMLTEDDDDLALTVSRLNRIAKLAMIGPPASCTETRSRHRTAASTEASVELWRTHLIERDVSLKGIKPQGVFLLPVGAEPKYIRKVEQP